MTIVLRRPTIRQGGPGTGRRFPDLAGRSEFFSKGISLPMSYGLFLRDGRSDGVDF